MTNPGLWTPDEQNTRIAEVKFGGRDPWWYLVHDGPRYIAEARAMAEQANHYDGFNVGSIVLAASNEGDIFTFTGANQKLVEGKTDTKICAELVALEKMVQAEKAANAGKKEHEPQTKLEVIGLFVSGPPQPDTHSGVVTPTLHSCGLDREVMWNEPSVRPDTLIVSIHPDRDLYEVYEQEELQTMHALPGEISPQGYVDTGFGIWAAATPAYERTVAAVYEMTEGSEPPRAYIARMAITGRISPQALNPL